MTEAADYLARMAEDWTRNPFVAISNEGATGQEFLGHLKAVLAELAELAEAKRLPQSTGLITTDQLAWARREAEGSCRICDAPQVLRLLLAAYDQLAAGALPGLGLNDHAA